ncbi:MAG: class I SAM-dependent methyltransferase [Bergeyella cardium]
MKIKDHFLSKKEFSIIETDIEGIFKTSPLPQNLTKYYESRDYISHHQDSGSIKEKIYKFLQRFNLNYKRNILAAEAGIHLKVLDYGCGAGEFVKFIENEYTTFGFEPNEHARNFAQKKSNKTKFLTKPDLSEIEDNSLDIITLWHVFEHLEDRDYYLDLFYKKLKPEGVLIIAVPNYTSYDGQKYKEFWAAYDVPRHIWHYSRNGMQRLINTTQWKIKKIKPLLLDAYYISMLSEKYKKNPLFWLKGFIVGAISNYKAVKNGEFSSLVYIIGKS